MVFAGCALAGKSDLYGTNAATMVLPLAVFRRTVSASGILRPPLRSKHLVMYSNKSGLILHAVACHACLIRTEALAISLISMFG